VGSLGLYSHVINTGRSELRKVLFLALSVTFLFVCFFHVVRESNISETAERICARFTGKTRLVPCSDELECQGQRSKVKGQDHEVQKRFRRSRHPPTATEWSRLLHAARYNALSTGSLPAVYVW